MATGKLNTLSMATHHLARLATSGTSTSNLCRSKASFLASQDSSEATKSRWASAALLWLIATALWAMALILTNESDWSLRPRLRPIPQTRRARFFAVATVLLGIAGFFMAMHVYSVQHVFYCTETPDWKVLKREWVVAAFAAGLPALCAVLDWMFFAANTVLGKRPARIHITVPFSVVLITALASLPLLAAGTATSITILICVLIGGLAGMVLMIVGAMTSLLTYSLYWALFSLGMYAPQPSEPFA